MGEPVSEEWGSVDPRIEPGKDKPAALKALEGGKRERI